MDNLTPTRKMKAVGISGALTVFVITVINIYFPGVGDLMSAPVEAAVVSLVTFASGWLTAEKK